MDFDGWKRRPDPVSLSALLETVEPRVERICRRILRDPHDAEEAKQEVLLEIAKGIGAVVDGTHFDRWVGKIAFRTALDRRRMRLRRAAHESRAGERVANGNGADDALHESMSRLEDEDRELLIERYFDRRTLREMGRRRGISAVAVRKRIAGAQDRLKRMLGCAIPGALWKGAFSVGVAAMNTKTAATIAVIVLPLLLLGGGVFVAAAKRTPGVPGQTPESRHRFQSANSSSESGLRVRPVKSRLPGPPSSTTVLSEGPLAWSRLHAVLDRIVQTRKRIEKLKTESRHSLSEMEGRRLQVEAKLLEDEVKTDLEELKSLALQAPTEVVGFISEWRHHMARQDVDRAIQQGIEAEIESEGSASSPLLGRLLSLAGGDLDDRMALLKLVSGFSRANRDIGQTCVALLADTEPEVRLSSAQALYAQAWRGNLKEILTEQSAELIRVASADSDRQVQGSVLAALAFIETPAADEAILQRFESAVTESDLGPLWYAMNYVSPRAGSRDEARLAASLTRILARPLSKDSVSNAAYLSFGLPPARCVEILKLALSKIPVDEVERADYLSGLIRSVEAGEIEKLRHSMLRHR